MKIKCNFCAFCSISCGRAPESGTCISQRFYYYFLSGSSNACCMWLPIICIMNVAYLFSRMVFQVEVAGMSTSVAMSVLPLAATDCSIVQFGQ